MKRTWAIIGVGGVSASLKWYQTVFGQPPTFLPMIGKFSIQMEPFCSASTSGAPTNIPY
jgi:hypothetical protein